MIGVEKRKVNGIGTWGITNTETGLFYPFGYLPKFVYEGNLPIYLQFWKSKHSFYAGNPINECPFVESYEPNTTSNINININNNIHIEETKGRKFKVID